MRGQKCLKILGEYFPGRKIKNKTKTKTNQQKTPLSHQGRDLLGTIFGTIKSTNGSEKMRMKERGKEQVIDNNSGSDHKCPQGPSHGIWIVGVSKTLQ